MFSIRRASETDVDALSPLKASVHDEHVGERPDVFKPMKPEDVSAWLRKRLADEATHVWMAEDDGVPIGYVLATRRQREESSYSVARQWCEIDEIVVDPAHRRRGVARALMARAIAHARELSLDAIELSAWAFNEPAQAAFERLGFERMLVRHELGTGRGSFG
jgi:ribosomal protein S18 acetylase RimI-like enzyme